MDRKLQDDVIIIIKIQAIGTVQCAMHFFLVKISFDFMHLKIQHRAV